ncbi:MAG: pyrroline-5-carboxylate reductase [Gammaproteobacteria bacterium]|nr:pyrroline-5-carboxylate reductase [Gammaproteobacteria bacterium]
MKHPSIAFIGAGNMASSLIGGLIADRYPANKIWASNPKQDELSQLQECFEIHVTPDNREAANACDILVLAVKPSLLKSVILEISDILRERKPLIISIVTGIRSETIMKWAECNTLSIVRCMPNTPALLRCGTTGLCPNAYVSEEEQTTAESILRSVGVTVWFDDEQDLDVVTALSGSGPAYFFLVMEAMIETATALGLDPEQAQLLTVNTAIGAARMALESGKAVHVLREQVTSPGGTTEQAIGVLESGGIRDLFARALIAAKNKASEMSQLLE